MPDLPREYSKGERLRATDWNRAARAINSHQSALERIAPSGRVMGMRPMPAVMVDIHNGTGAELSPRDIGGIKEHAFADDPENIVLTVEAPAAGTHEGKFVVVQEEIPTDGIGKAVIVGCALCTVSLVDENHEYAEIMDGETGKLESRPAGSAKILWHESVSGSGSGTEDVLALVQFPLDGPPPVWEATADESSGEITAKRIDSSGTVQGEEITFTVLPE